MSVDGTVGRSDSSGGMTAGSVRPPAEWPGRVLLLSAVAFWWGAVVAPQLVSLAFPELLGSSAIPWHLNPNTEGSVANAISAAALLAVGILACVNALRSFGSAQDRPFGWFGKLTAGRLGTQDAVHGWIAVAGWAALAATATFLAWEEMSEFKAAAGMSALGDTLLGAAYRSSFWPVLVSPLILVFVLAMGVFVRKGIPSTSSGRQVRALLVLGLAAWLLAVAHEASYVLVFEDKAQVWERLLEETLEFGGTLVIGLGAAIALRGPATGVFGRRRLLKLLAGSMAAVAVLAVIAAVAYRTSLTDARAPTHVGTFYVTLNDEESLVQELGALPAPPGRLELRVANHDPQGRSGTMLWRVMEAGEGGSGRIFREGRLDVPAGEYPSWRSIIGFPRLAEAEGRPLAVQLVAEVEPEAHLRVGAAKTNRHEDRRLWIRGIQAWPDQNIEFITYMATEPTLGKLRDMWRVFTSDWRWLALLADAAIATTLIIFIPALLVTAALPRRSLP